MKDICILLFLRYQAVQNYIHTLAVMSMVGYILGLGDRYTPSFSDFLVLKPVYCFIINLAISFIKFNF